MSEEVWEGGEEAVDASAFGCSQREFVEFDHPREVARRVHDVVPYFPGLVSVEIKEWHGWHSV